jgi:hypothetical protein
MRRSGCDRHEVVGTADFACRESLIGRCFQNGYEALTKDSLDRREETGEPKMTTESRNACELKSDETVVAFPLSGRRGTIRRCARELENIHGEAATRYWRTECRALADSLAQLGCSEDDIHVQVMAFQTEVQLEMMKRYTERLDTGDRENYRFNP